jgi:hypothetical protein
MHYEEERNIRGWAAIPLWLPITFILCELTLSILDGFNSFSLTRAIFAWLNVIAIAMILDARKALKK